MVRGSIPNRTQKGLHLGVYVARGDTQPLQAKQEGRYVPMYVYQYNNFSSDKTQRYQYISYSFTISILHFLLFEGEQVQKFYTWLSAPKASTLT